MADRFSEKVRIALGHRAGSRCSFPDCNQVTSGPAEGSSSGVASVGVAAHITAASSGGPRFNSQITQEKRKGVENGIWLCQTHARLIDSDEKSYPPDKLREMKASHEKRIAAELRREISPPAGVAAPLDLVALGPEIIATGRLVGGEGRIWRVEFHEFIRGSKHELLGFIERIEQQHEYDRYILVNDLGDGRVIGTTIRWEKTPDSLVIEAAIEPRFPRVEARDLGRTLAIDDEGDLLVKDGKVEELSGVHALRQKLMLNLGVQRDESPIHPLFGSRCAELYALYGNSAWFERLLKLEAVRFAAIPYQDEFSEGPYTPFQCVDQVQDVRVLDETPSNNRIEARLSLSVKGVGEWFGAIPIYVGPRSSDKPDGRS